MNYPLGLILAFLFFPLQACAASHSTPQTDISEGEQRLVSRAEWQQEQKLLRVSISLEVVTQGQPPTTQWMFVERTPNHRLKVIFRDNPNQQEGQLTYLNHDGVMLAMRGEDVAQPIASWMVGTFMFGQNLDPNLLLSWVFGLPGKSYSVENPMADVVFKNDHLSVIRQEGWNINYSTWNFPQNHVPSLPQTFQACKADICLNVTTVELQSYTTVPVDYTEFKII